MAAPGQSSERRSSKSAFVGTALTEYGESYQAHLIEQYKLYVESANKISDRRASANNHFLTLNTFLVSLLGVSTLASGTGFLQVVILVAGILVSVVWFGLIASYRNLNTAKFGVIHELEEKLPARPFASEWERCEHGIGKAYRPLTHVEKWVPLVFVALYVSLGLFVWLSKPSSVVQPNLHRPAPGMSAPTQAPPQSKDGR